MWPLRVYTRNKRAGQRLNLTPTPDLSAPTKAEAPPGPGLKGKRKAAQGLPKVVEKAERSRRGGSGSRLLSTQLRVTGEKSLKENSTSEETQDEKSPPLTESVTDLQVDSSSSNSELVSGLSLQHDISSSLLSYSVTDSYTECNSFEESLSSFSSPELFRASGYLDREYPKLEERMQCRNSTLLDSSKAVAVEKAPQFSNLSAILGTSSEDYQKCYRKTAMTLADQNLFPEPKSTSNLESDNAACEVLLAEKTCPPAPEKTKKKKTNPTIPDKKRRGLLTSTPSSQTGGFVIDLSSVQKASFEELFPIVSNYVNSNEIVPMSSLQEDSSYEIPSNTSEICCIIRASPGTRQVKIKGVTVKKKKYSPCKGIPQDIIINTNGRI
ncbi:meiosis-specific kinetochore protein [Trichechus manatus latirostris]|uniref:Meiosis-specific kinetochore protein n=1 Tax=Trichechus manatus latirostris TaxID=127582 RepID=A0A2Y9G1Z7_TRIMA|nr:meiosis-specific kinetochore protein [Trichechus manatus latirostris]